MNRAISERTHKSLPCYRSMASPLRRSRPTPRTPRSHDEHARRVVRVPISSLRSSATAIDRLAITAGAFTEVVESLPQLMRWHTELLMLELESLESVGSTREDLHAFVQSVDSIAETARQMPGELRGQFDAALEQALDVTDVRQASLRATVSEARLAIQDLDGAIARANDMVASAESTSDSLTQAA